MLFDYDFAFDGDNWITSPMSSSPLSSSPSIQSPPPPFVPSMPIMTSPGTRLIMTVPSHSDLVSITGALIVFSFISSCVILTYIINGFHLLWGKMIRGELVPESRTLLSNLITLSSDLVSYVSGEISSLTMQTKFAVTSWIRWKSKSLRWPLSTASMVKKRV